jgi:branched-chain amino acid transport system ATP-binding protein
MLKVANLDAHIEKTQILRQVSLDQPKGAMAGLIGRNGAGKTTLMRSIMGLRKTTSGTIAFERAGLPKNKAARETYPRPCSFDRVDRRSHGRVRQLVTR